MGGYIMDQESPTNHENRNSVVATTVEENQTAKINPADNDVVTEEQPQRYPEFFYCPITKKIMLDPMVHPNGNSYEKGAVKGGDSSYPNRALKGYIEQVVNHQEGEAQTLTGTVTAQRSGLLHRSDSDKDRSLPDAFYCPISFNLMIEPVIDPEGNTYDRVAICKWIKVHQNSPITRSKLSANQLYDNNSLLNAIMDTCFGSDRDSMLNTHQRFKDSFAIPETADAPAPTTASAGTNQRIVYTCRTVYRVPVSPSTNHGMDMDALRPREIPPWQWTTTDRNWCVCLALLGRFLLLVLIGVLVWGVTTVEYTKFF